MVAGGLSSPYSHDTANRPANTVTVSGSGAHAGFVNFYTVPIYASDCTTVTPKEPKKLLSVFVYRFLQAQQSYIYAHLKRGAAVPHVYPKDLAELVIPIPPMSEQKRIVAHLDEIATAIQSMTDLYEKKVDKLAELKQSLLRKAFVGELTADSNVSGRALSGKVE